MNNEETEMTEKIQSEQLFLNTKFSLQRIYSLLNRGNPDGISTKDLSSYSDLSLTDIPFVQFLQENMNTIDADSDKNISEKELNNLLSTIKDNGFTQEQLLSMAAGSNFGVGLDKSLLDTVLANFSEIDMNKDGKVSQAEIDYYSFNKEVEDKKTELNEFKASDISVFYGDSSIEKTDDSNDESDTDTNADKA